MHPGCFLSLSVCWPRTPSLTQLSSLSIAHTLFILIERERESEMSHSHIIHFSLKDTRIWSSLLVRPIDQSETTVKAEVRSRHNVLTKQCLHRCTHKTQYKGVGRRKQTLTHICDFLPENTNTLFRIKLKLQISSLLNAYKLQDKSSRVKYFV